tara:strand:+ start:309 stop:548 length:240 start_codon:yes stop_codon:yes gene_type:complete
MEKIIEYKTEEAAKHLESIFTFCGIDSKHYRLDGDIAGCYVFSLERLQQQEFEDLLKQRCRSYLPELVYRDSVIRELDK